MIRDPLQFHCNKVQLYVIQMVDYYVCTTAYFNICLAAQHTSWLRGLIFTSHSQAPLV